MESKKKNHPAVRGANDQEASHLFRLPQELRLSIYKYVFKTTRISHGERTVGRANCIQITPIMHSLALLRTCRRMSNEIQDSWLGQVLFSFEDPTTMLDKLTALPIARLAKLRHVRVRGETIMLSFEEDDVHYRLVHALQLLPGLQLDTFTVLNMYGGTVSYDVLNTLILYGNGWKELRFISHTSALLGYAYPDGTFAHHIDNERYQRQPQPSHWASVMNSRDGIKSGPAVTVYRSTLSGQVCSVINEATRVVFKQQPPGKDETAAFGTQEYRPIMSSGEKKREMMVVVKRGKGVDYQQKEDSQHLDEIGDIRDDCPDMTWAKIKKKHCDLLDEEDDLYWSDDDFSGATSDIPKIVDSYQDVDEYGWTRLNWDPDP